MKRSVSIADARAVAGSRPKHGYSLAIGTILCSALLLAMVFQHNLGLKQELQESKAQTSILAASFSTQLDEARGQLKKMEQHLKRQQEQLAEEANELKQQLADRDEVLAEKIKELQQLQVLQHQHQLAKAAEAAVYRASKELRQQLAADAAKLRAAWEGRLAKQRQQGIVLAVGASLGELSNAFAALFVLRRHANCTLPVAVMYWGALEPGAVDGRVVQFFKDHIPHVDFVDMSTVPYPDYQRTFSPQAADGSFAGHTLKSYALYTAPFKEVLVMDTASLPLSNPSSLFQAEQYKKHGSLFWPDLWSAGSTLDLGAGYRKLRLKDPWQGTKSTLRGTGAAAFVFSRARHWQVLEWVLFLTGNHDTTFKFPHFETEVYGVAFSLAGSYYAFQKAPLWPGMSLWSHTRLKGVLQLHPDGSALFHHHSYLRYSVAEGWEPQRTTHVTPMVSEDLAYACVHSSKAGGEGEDLVCPEEQVIDVPQCQVNLTNLPGTRKSCSPDYMESLPRGEPQRLPLYLLPQDSSLTAAEAVADSAFSQFREAVKPLLQAQPVEPDAEAGGA